MKKEKTSFAFTGDIGFDRYMDRKWEDPELLSEEVLDFLKSADHVVANVEGPLLNAKTNTVKTGVQQLLHTMNPEVVTVLKGIGADVWNICNNHIMDAGEEGIRATLREAKAAGAATLGAGMDISAAASPLIFDEAGGIGLLGVGYRRGCKGAAEDKAGCLLWNDMDNIRRGIDEIKEKCRWCVIVAHGGEEFTALPTPYTRDRYLKYLEMGADIVVCHHPHVPMNYETAGDKAVFYSLGNFIFDTDYQRAQYNTERGVLLRIDFTPEKFSFEAMGIETERGPEHVVRAPLPRIFTDVQPDQYELLEPLAARMFVAATKRQQIYLNPGMFAEATPEMWAEHFANPRRSGRVEGEALDFFVVLPLAEKEKEKKWMESTLEGVKEYILEQM